MTPSFEDCAPDRYGLVYHFSQISPQKAAELRAKAEQADAAEAAQKAARQAPAAAAV
jgi:hypothetical protein